jgi:uncharacterized protein (TIGR03382 family)
MCSQAFASVIVNTGGPTNGMAMASRPDSTGKTEIEAADDFIVAPGGSTFINSGTFTGLLSGSVAVPTVQNVIIEIYRVFPLDSTSPPSGNVLTRANSPSDVAFSSFDASASQVSFTTMVLGSSFTALNSVQPGGIHPTPGQTTGGNGPVTGQEVQFNFAFTTPFLLPADHYFFVPQVQVSGGEFFWLSGDRPLTGGDVGPTPDLQAWIRDEALQPDWSRVGTDIVGGATPPTFNGAFSLDATVTPEPATFGLCFAALGLTGWVVRRRRSE